MAVTNVYIDNLNGSDATADGTNSSTPYKTFQAALNGITPANQTIFWVADTQDETISTALSWTSTNNWSSTLKIVRGWDQSGSNNGYGGWDFNNANNFGAANTPNNTLFYKMLFKNGGSTGTCFDVGESICFFDCQITDCPSTSSCFEPSHQSGLIYCYIQDGRGECINLTQRGGFVYGCYIKSHATNGWTHAIRSTTQSSCIINNIVWNQDSTGDGINCMEGVCANNTVFADGGTSGMGIRLNTNSMPRACFNNHIEGWNIGMTFQNNNVGLYGYNSFYNNTTNIGTGEYLMIDLGNDVTPGASPLTDATNGDFSVGAALKALGFPTEFPNLSTTNQFLDIGAAQRQEAAAGSTVIHKVKRYM